MFENYDQPKEEGLTNAIYDRGQETMKLHRSKKRSRQNNRKDEAKELKEKEREKNDYNMHTIRARDILFFVTHYYCYYHYASCVVLCCVVVIICKV